MNDLTPDASEHTDVLPADLNAVDNRLPFKYPDNSRRRIPGTIYVASGIVVLLVVALADSQAVLVNRGLMTGAILLVLVGIMSISSGWKMKIDEQAALTLAGSALRFTIGHASAQQVWRGLRSRPSWRVLAYSDEEPPRLRGLVLVDAVDGSVVQSLVESCQDEWTAAD
ncbi:MAG: hypothetical protein RL391_482 [Actinomycetota bacterium]|jgi:uncharacterized membrane protein YqjE